MTPRPVIIEAGSTQQQYWRDLWRYRELFLVMAWRDVAVRYKQTLIGLVWALLQPLLIMVGFTVIFGKVAKMPSEGSAPYALLVFSGLLAWQLFATSLTGAANSLIGNANLVAKVYFPRLVVPASAVVVSFIDFLISLLLLAGLMVWYGFAPDWQILTLPAFVLMAFLASLGPGLWVSALNVRFRDFRYVVPFIVQFGLYVSPVGFSSSVISPEWRLLYNLNPIVGVIDGFRWAILGNESPFYLPGFLISWAVILSILWLGVRQFRGMERTLADVI
jgi:lipopolysaccharide transport system permease protein